MKNSILIQVGNPPSKSAQTADLTAFVHRKFSAMEAREVAVLYFSLALSDDETPYAARFFAR
ncbi:MULTISPECIES: hypothetical protein [Agrobacterium]|uniref:hypothetical protein n=1 Tax=Agrobacterium TaxID=357 RepID=UPI00103463E6|nr:MULTISPECIES: hypothetical protein [Agrobacterium]QCL76080.1 hypothetical protein CFBP5499_21815 [Agrobacterium tumefaciens]